jgi:hypothetical protein
MLAPPHWPTFTQEKRILPVCLYIGRPNGASDAAMMRIAWKEFSQNHGLSTGTFDTLLQSAPTMGDAKADRHLDGTV